MAKKGLLNMIKQYKFSSIDENVFDEINEESAYWIGFIVADGCLRIRPDRGYVKYITFTLAGYDHNHLEKFKNFCKSSANISLDSSSKVQLHVRSDGLYDKLIEYGLCPRKSTVPFNITNKELVNSKHFWRGVIDGDGSIFINKDEQPILKLGSTCNDLILQFKEFIFNNTNQQYNIYCDYSGKSKFYTIIVKSYNAAKLIKLLYNDTSVYLDRKYDKSMEILTEWLELRKHLM